MKRKKLSFLRDLATIHNSRIENFVQDNPNSSHPLAEGLLPDCPTQDEGQGDDNGGDGPCVGPGEYPEKGVIGIIQLVPIMSGDVVEVHVEQLVGQAINKNHKDLVMRCSVTVRFDFGGYFHTIFS